MEVITAIATIFIPLQVADLLYLPVRGHSMSSTGINSIVANSVFKCTRDKFQKHHLVHGVVFSLAILVLAGFVSNGVLLAEGNAFMVVGYPSHDLVHTSEDADP